MWPLTWLKNRIANRSIDDLVNSGLKGYEIEYDPYVGGRFYGTKSPELGFALYHRFYHPKEFEANHELEKDICTYLKSFYSFLDATKNSIQQNDFLRLAYTSFIAWQTIAKLKIRPPKDKSEEEETDESYEEPQGKYLKISWTQEDAENVELAKQIKSRITPDTKLSTISMDFSGIILVDDELRKHGYPVYLSSRAMSACKKRDISYLMKQLYFSLEDIYFA